MRSNAIAKAIESEEQLQELIAAVSEKEEAKPKEKPKGTGKDGKSPVKKATAPVKKAKVAQPGGVFKGRPALGVYFFAAATGVKGKPLFKVTKEVCGPHLPCTRAGQLPRTRAALPACCRSCRARPTRRMSPYSPGSPTARAASSAHASTSSTRRRRWPTLSPSTTSLSSRLVTIR